MDTFIEAWVSAVVAAGGHSTPPMDRSKYEAALAQSLACSAGRIRKPRIGPTRRSQRLGPSLHTTSQPITRRSTKAMPQPDRQLRPRKKLRDKGDATGATDTTGPLAGIDEEHKARRSDSP